MSDHDDFWGDVPDWTLDAEAAERAQHRSERRTPRTSWRRRVTDLLGTGADSTREHGIVRTDAMRGHDADDVAPAPDTAHDLPTGALPRVDAEEPATAPAPIDISDDFDDRRTAVAAPPAGGVDPLLARFGAVAVVLTLMVPLALNVASDDGVDDMVASATEAAEAEATTGASIAEAVTPDATVAAPTATEPTYLDPADLPPAVPVNEVGSGDETTTTEQDADTDDDLAGRAGSSDEGSGTTAATSTTGSAAAVNDAADADDQADRLRLECAVDYTVVAGDFWIGLADRAGVELAELLEANAASVQTPLYPGADICLPAGAVTPAPPATAAPTTAAPTTAAPTTAAPTTAAPTTAAPTTTPPTVPAGPEEIMQIIRNVWPDDLEDRALEVAYRESRYVPTAKNFCCYGLFQIYWNVHRGWLADLGITSAEQLYDPETNARAAYALYQRAGGWGPWSL